MEMKPSINLRELRSTRRLRAWLKAGKTVELLDRNRILGRIVPESLPVPVSARPKRYPNFAARAKRIFGERLVPAVDIVIEERGRF